MNKYMHWVCSQKINMCRFASRLILFLLSFGLVNESRAFTSTATGATLVSNTQGKPNSPSGTITVSGSVGSASAFPIGSPLTITGTLSTGNTATTFYTQYVLVNGGYAGIGYEQGSPYIEEVYTVPSGTTYTPTSPGTYTFALYGYGGDAGIGDQILIESAAVTITVYNPVTPLTAVTITGPATYTGSSLTPTYTTTPSGGTVTFSPTTETNAGTYTLNWTATGSYSGSGTASWTINKASLAAASIQSVVYNGSAQQPSAVTSTIPAGIPVTVSSSSSHINTGAYTDGIVTTAGNANLNAGTLSGLSWAISAIPIIAATIQSVPNNGAAQFPSVVASVTPSGATVSVTSTTSHTAAGSYSDGIVTGTGNFSGTLSGLPWTITAQTQASVSVTPGTITVAYGQSATLTASGGSGTGAYTFTNSGSVLGSPTITSTTDTVAFSTIGNSSVSLYRAADSNYAQSGTASATVTVTKATPVGSLASQTITSATTLTSQMLNAVFTNPNSTAATAPTGAVTYSASGYGAIAVGATLPLGSYTVTASYPGDSRYNPATTTATFTVLTILSQNIYSYQGGGTVTYTAPAQTNYVIAKVWGAGGGEGVLCPGGGGGFSYGATAFNSGQTLSVVVGGAGSGSMTGGPPGGGTAAGLGGAGGGGYSRVWNSSINIWAGAGGGGGNGANFSGVGGAGGGPNASPGGGGSISGGGGTQTGGGAGGSGNDAPGSVGTAGAGGASNHASDYIGGAGGAGYYGGGGGGTGTYGNGGGGGGGGSSFISLPTTLGSNSVSYFSNGSGTTPGGTTDPDFPTSSGSPTVAAGGNSGTYANGLNGYVIIDSVIMPQAPTFSNVPSQSAPATFVNCQPLNYQINATASPAITSYSVASGSSLPAGLILNSSTGIITGNYSSPPTGNASFTPGNATFSTQITATNSFASTTVTYYWLFTSPVITLPTYSYSNPTPLAGQTVTFNYTASANDGIYWTEGELWPPSGPPTNLQNSYPNGYPTTFSDMKTIVAPSQPGTYTYQLRIVDQYKNFCDFWPIFQIGEETDPLPYATSFETTENPAWAPGQLNVENGWMTWQGGTYVVQSPSYPVEDQSYSLQLMGSTQYATLDGNIPILVQMVKAFNTSGGAYSGAYIDEYMEPVASSSVLNSSIINNTDGEIGFQTINSSQATVMVLNGNGTGGGTWTDTGIHFSIDSTGKSTVWMRISVLHNYSNYQNLPSHTWYLWINGAFYPQSSTSPIALGMVNTTSTSITALTWFGSSNTGYLDNLHLRTTNPFATPAAPTITSVSSSAAGSFTVNWTAPSDPYGINSYQLELAVGSGSYSVVGTTTGTSYTVTGLTTGTTYSFKVIAENVSGNYSPWSAAFTTTLTSLQLVSGTQLSFTYNGATQGPAFNSSTVTSVPSTATFVVTGQATATNAGIFNATLTPKSTGNPSFVGPPLTISWTLNPATPTLTLTASPTTVSLGGAVTFTVHPTIPGNGTITYSWSVTPSGPSGLSGSGTVQTLTFPSQAIAGNPPVAIPYTISVFSNANSPNYLQSSTVQYQISVTVPSNPDTSDTTVQLNVHAPTQ
jgi:hypothetical protein